MNTFKKGDVVKDLGTVAYTSGPYVYFTNGQASNYEYCTLVPQPQPKFKPGDVVRNNHSEWTIKGVKTKNYDGSPWVRGMAYDYVCDNGIEWDFESTLTLVRRATNAAALGDYLAAAVAAPKVTTKFKVGDRVKSKTVPEAGVGIIQDSAFNKDGNWSVNFKDSWYSTCLDHESSLTLVESSTPTIVVRNDGAKGYRPNDKPRVHNTVEEATKEAERLALKNPGVSFDTFTLVSKSVATAPVAGTVSTVKM